jgi:hypothetical protein
MPLAIPNSEGHIDMTTMMPFSYVDLSGDTQLFDLAYEVALVNRTNDELDELIGVAHALYALAGPNALTTIQRMHIDLCSRVEGF